MAPPGCMGVKGAAMSWNGVGVVMVDCLFG